MLEERESSLSLNCYLIRTESTFETLANIWHFTMLMKWIECDRFTYFFPALRASLSRSYLGSWMILLVCSKRL